MNDIILYALLKKYHKKGSSGGGGSESKSHKIIEQKTPSDKWILEHNMDCFPSVTIVDSGNNLVVGDVNYVNSNTIEVTFCAPFSGKALLV